VKRLVVAAAMTLGLAAVAVPRGMQAQSRNIPRVAFSTADFAKLKWLAGDWAGTAVGEKPLYERIAFVDDSTAEFTYYRDAGFTEQSGTGRLYLSVGRVYHTFGANRWAATRVDENGIYFIPQTSAHNNFEWTRLSPDEWRSTMRTGISGHQQVVVYNMKRVPR